MADYKNVVLRSLSRWENPKKPGTGYELRVIHMIADNKSRGVGVEKVYFYQDGAKSIGKPLQKMDFKKCAEFWPQIIALMDNPPPMPEVQPMQSDTLEEIPF